MATPPTIQADLTEFRRSLRVHGLSLDALVRLQPMRPLLDIAFDLAIVCVAATSVVSLGWWLAPLAALLIANRQRALGNILHDAGHRNLYRSQRLNDALARLLVAPLAMVSLTAYRRDHFNHHRMLGDAGGDPDYLPPLRSPANCWWTSYSRFVFCWPAWKGSLLGHLVSPAVSARSKVYIACWWAAVAGGSFWAGGTQIAVEVMVLWLLSRATFFHLITTFREMCDHFGMKPGGILSFTRDVIGSTPWRWIIHPRNNGYHLTHHLAPAVPYYLLPKAHRLFREMSLFQTHGTVCARYFSGAGAVTGAWQTKEPR